MGVSTKADRYEGINGLKAYAIIGIALMHVLSNGKYELGGFVFEKLIPNFTNLVFLFMMVSGFGMCCGYYQKIIDRKISVEEFYSKRYIKIWSYFALLCALDFVISPSKNSLYEVFANLTLCQGLLPNANISVIGVSWTLAVIFVFYMLFPFFCFLIGNKKRAWGVAAAALVFNYLCGSYFNAGRTNIVYDAIYFIAGGLIFLYRKELAEFAVKSKVIAGAILLIATVAYFAVGGNTLMKLFFCDTPHLNHAFSNGNRSSPFLICCNLNPVISCQIPAGSIRFSFQIFLICFRIAHLYCQHRTDGLIVFQNRDVQRNPVVIFHLNLCDLFHRSI